MHFDLSVLCSGCLAVHVELLLQEDELIIL